MRLGTVAGMTISVGMVTFDTLDAVALAAWWARQTSGTIHDDSDGWYVMVAPPEGRGPVLAFQKVPDPTPGKNRLHVDVTAPDREAEVERLLADGATLVDRQEHEGFAWVVLADPDGNRFCVSQAHAAA